MWMIDRRGGTFAKRSTGMPQRGEVFAKTS